MQFSLWLASSEFEICVWACEAKTFSILITKLHRIQWVATKWPINFNLPFLINHWWVGSIECLLAFALHRFICVNKFTVWLVSCKRDHHMYVLCFRNAWEKYIFGSEKSHLHITLQLSTRRCVCMREREDGREIKWARF